MHELVRALPSLSLYASLSLSWRTDVDSRAPLELTISLDIGGERGGKVGEILVKIQRIRGKWKIRRRGVK